MIDRQSANPFRFKLTHEDGSVEYVTLERADNPTAIGTPLNKNTLFSSTNSERYVAELPSEAFDLLAREIVVSVPASGWSSETNEEGYFTQTVEAEGMSQEYTPIYSLEIGTAETIESIQEAFSLVPRAVTSDNFITFYATEIPQADMSIRLKGV